MFCLKIKSYIIRFYNNNFGNIAVTFGLVLIPILLFVGLGVDYSRMVATRSQLQSALDAALLSVADDVAKGRVSQSNFKATLDKYLDENVNSDRFNLANTKIQNLQTLGNQVTATAQTEFKYAFPLFGAGQSRTILVDAQVSSQAGSLEVALVLDTSSSMNYPVITPDVGDPDTPKTALMKNSVNNALNLLFAPPATNIRASLVPFGLNVRVGSQFQSATDTASLCAFERTGIHMFDDASYSVKKVHGDTTTCTASPKLAPIENQIIPLTSDKTQLINAVNGLGDGGGTSGHVGIEWGQYMLSPKWKRLMTASQYPAAYNSAGAQKVMIIFTDGAFNGVDVINRTTAQRSTTASGTTVPVHPNAPYTDYSSDFYSSKAAQLAVNYCNNLKNNGVVIYTVGFDLHPVDWSAAGYPVDMAKARAAVRDPSDTSLTAVQEYWDAVKLLHMCASSPNHVFMAQTASSLTQALEKIVQSILNEKIRLTD